MKRIYIFFALVLFSIATAFTFIWEAQKDKQTIAPLMRIGTDTVRNVAETATVGISVTLEEEQKIGESVLKYFSLLPEDHELSTYVRGVGEKLAAHSLRKEVKYRFYVDQSGMVNAFALPGGIIVVTHGMVSFARKEDELAWVIGHEIAHIEVQHALVRLRMEVLNRKVSLPASQLLQRLVEVGYSNNMELEADRRGLQIMAKAGYDPKASLNLIRAMQKGQLSSSSNRNPVHMGVKLTREAIRTYFSTHPVWADREQEIQKEILRLPKQGKEDS